MSRHHRDCCERDCCCEAGTGYGANFYNPGSFGFMSPFGFGGGYGGCGFGGCWWIWIIILIGLFFFWSGRNRGCCNY